MYNNNKYNSIIIMVQKKGMERRKKCIEEKRIPSDVLVYLCIAIITYRFSRPSLSK